LNRVRQNRQQKGFSQAELARLARISRSGLAAIERGELVPSVHAALALSRALGASVEELFLPPPPEAPAWAWTPSRLPCGFWRAEFPDGERLVPAQGAHPASPAFDGWFDGGLVHFQAGPPQRTLVLACCDPAAGLLVARLAQVGVRLVVLQRSSGEALELLAAGAVHVAGLHLAGEHDSRGNSHLAGERLGPGFRLLRVALWEEGVACQPSAVEGGLARLSRPEVRWVGRKPGAGARACQDLVLGAGPAPENLASDHSGVVAAIRQGWAQAGVCPRYVAEAAGLGFLSVRREPFDLCHSQDLEQDPRLQALSDAVRCRAFQQRLGCLPGYRVEGAGEMQAVVTSQDPPLNAPAGGGLGTW